MMMNDYEMHTYFCAHCGAETKDYDTPAGWYALARYRVGNGRRFVKLGLFCTAGCLAARMPALQHHDRLQAERTREEAAA